MRKFIRRCERFLKVGVLCVLAGLAGVLVVRTYGSLSPEEQAEKEYAEYMNREAICPEDLADLWAEEAWRYIGAAIPGAEC